MRCIVVIKGYIPCGCRRKKVRSFIGTYPLTTNFDAQSNFLIFSMHLQGGPRIYGRHFSKQDLQFLHYTAKKGLETMPKVYFNLY